MTAYVKKKSMIRKKAVKKKQRNHGWQVKLLNILENVSS